jgi:hypothetical protein
MPLTDLDEPSPDEHLTAARGADRASVVRLKDDRGGRLESRRKRVAGFMTCVAAALALCAAGPPQAERVVTTFRVTIGGTPVADGQIWLYYYGWGYLERYRLGDVREGEAHVELTARAVREQINLPSNVDAVFVALHALGAGWYRIADLEPSSDLLLPAVDRLGRPDRTGSSKVIALPPPTARHLRLLNTDGSPRAGMQVEVEPFVSRSDHCGAHSSYGDEDSRFEATTDDQGVTRFIAPPGPLFLKTGHYEESATPLGRLLTCEPGEDLDAAADHTLRHVWDPEPDRTFHLHVRRPDGSPATSAALFVDLSVNACGLTWGRATGRAS